MNKEFENEYNQMIKKYQDKLVNFEKEQREKESQKAMQPEANEFIYEVKKTREIKNGVETGKVVKTKTKKEGDKLIKEVKTTTLNPDGTKDVLEITEDASGKKEVKKKLDKDNQVLSIEE